MGQGDAMARIAKRSATPSSRGALIATPQPARSKLALAVAAALSGAAAMHGAPALAAAATASATSDSLEEIIVTARKREENLQDVPMSINVFTSKDLQNLAISQFEDYATLTPSISFVSAGPATQTFVMRGVSDGTNPNYPNEAATGFLVDDMSMNYYGTTPDLHFYDIERIEVLNGPQGTTFGAGAMSGALRFITNKPDASAFSAGVDLDGGIVESGSHNGTAEGFINLPIIADWTALRISAYSDYHGGFINNLNRTIRSGRARTTTPRRSPARALRSARSLRRTGKQRSRTAISVSSHTAPGTRTRPSAVRSVPTVPRWSTGPYAPSAPTTWCASGRSTNSIM
jgi:iron complex outermembrane receptor protein